MTGVLVLLSAATITTAAVIFVVVVAASSHASNSDRRTPPIYVITCESLHIYARKREIPINLILTFESDLRRAL